ncbi:MAG: FAD-binding oxidoreductase [Methanobacteriota archaeon]|nr:MAG: FAD-binding oxidoreductase [Euryarchaeota archaeon]
MAGESVRISSDNFFVTCTPDTSCAGLLSSLRKHNRTLASYPAGSKGMTIGEWISKRLPSMGSFSQGGPEEQVRSLRIVLGSGKTIDTGYHPISNFSTGYDLNRLFVGSYDTLGKLTQVTLKLIPSWEAILPITFSFPNPETILEALDKVIGGSTSPYNISFLIVPSYSGKEPTNILGITYAGPKDVLNVEEERISTELEGLNGKRETTEVSNGRWRRRFFSDKMVDMGHAFVDKIIVPLASFNSFLSGASSINTLLAFSCLLLDRQYVAVGISLPKDVSTKVDLNDLRAKIGKLLPSVGGYRKDLSSWIESQTQKEDGGPVGRTMASIKTGADSKGRIASPAMDRIISKYALQKDVGTWRKKISRSRLKKSWPPKKGVLNARLRKRLESIVGEQNVAFDEFTKYYYTHDLAPLPKLVEIAFDMIPDAVARPQNAEQIAAIVQLSRENKIPLIGRGGGSWGFGGAIATQGGILLDLSSMREVLDIDEDRMLAYCEPSVTWEELYTQVERKGLMIGACPSSAPVATIGGWTNTGGAGVGSYKYGTAYSQVGFLKAVMSNGGMIDTESGGCSNRGPGYDLNALFSGSEGSLGIVTEVAVKLYPLAEETRPLAYSFKNAMALQQPLMKISQSNITPYNIGFYDEKNFEFLRMLGKEAPEVGSLLSIALRDSAAVNEVNEKSLDKLMVESGGKKESEELATHEWKERSYEMRIRRLGPGGTIGEGVIPTTRLAEMLSRAAKISREMKIMSTLRGVVVDRNSVAFMPFYLSNERFAIESLASMGFVKRIIDEAVKLDGRPSGLGVWFAWNLNNLHGKEGARIIRNIKEIIDIDNIMNPGKMTEMRIKWGIPIPGFLMNIGLNLLGMMKKALPRTKIAGSQTGG